ncbi:MAG: sugar phosphate isomerase/epimerase family protein [Armatimonadota bacterium]|nr:sugar phosphate isomerase/epimerase family protein [Armatimonadota bacterium]
MKICIMSYCYSRALTAGTLDFRGMLRECARLEAGVELLRRHADGWSADDLRSLTQDLGVPVPVLLESASIVDPDPARRANAADGARVGLDLAVTLGTKVMMVLPGGDPRGADDGEVRRWIGEGAQLICEAARGSGVRIVVENHGGAWRWRGRVEHMLHIFEHAPDLGLCFDNGNFFLAGETQEEAFARLQTRIAHVHFKDWHHADGDGKGVLARDGRRYTGAIIGEGVVPTRTTLSLLANAGYRGYLSVEYEGSEDPVAATARATRNLKAMAAALE